MQTIQLAHIKQVSGLRSKYKSQIQLRKSDRNRLEDEKSKLVKELKQVKMILKSPYLQSKYRQGKFEYLKNLNICKFTPPARSLEPVIDHQKASSMDRTEYRIPDSDGI